MRRIRLVDWTYPYELNGARERREQVSFKVKLTRYELGGSWPLVECGVEWNMNMVY